MREKPFASPGEALAHHGVKGMRWGVRKEEKLSGQGNSSKEVTQTNEATKQYMAELHKQKAKKVSPVENQALIEENYKKHLTKDDPSSDEGKGLSPTQKKLLIGAGIGVGIGVAVGGAYAYSRYAGNKPPIDWRATKKLYKPGDKVSPDEYQKLIGQSVKGSFGWPPMIKDSSFARPAMEFPPGHVFSRLSTSVESGFNVKDGNYAVHGTADLNRYIQGFSSEKGLGKQAGKWGVVSWTAKEPIKVPNLTTVLETLREGNPSMSHGEALREYQKLSGGSWTSDASRKLLRSLETKGFSAIVDELDAGVYGETPLVMFNTSKYSSKSYTPLTKSAIQNAKDNITEIANRKTVDSPFEMSAEAFREIQEKVLAS